MSDMLSLLNSLSPRRTIWHQPLAGTSVGLSAVAPGYFCSTRFTSASRPAVCASLVLVTFGTYPVTGSAMQPSPSLRRAAQEEVEDGIWSRKVRDTRVSTDCRVTVSHGALQPACRVGRSSTHRRQRRRCTSLRAVPGLGGAHAAASPR